MYCFRKVNHFTDLLPDMGGPSHPVVISYGGSSTNKHIADTGLTTAVALPVVTSKSLHQHNGEVDLTTHKNPLPRDKDIIQNSQRLVPAEIVVTHVDIPFLKLSRIAGLPTIDQRHPRGIGRYCTSDRIVLVTLSQIGRAHV